ncbi:antibiotic biosynthesis monooxygenase family protein [Mycolicibacterium sp. 624]|uniref:putative quinol monooxygenase n=1 Tax=Mycolicibacterium sp. 624 TaxID=3156314 RepID=UPI003392D743
MVTVLAHLRAKQGAGDAVEEFLTEIVPAARICDGCIEIRVVRELEDPDQLVVIEKWRDRASFEKSIALRAKSELGTDLARNLQKEPVIRFFAEANV